MNAQAPERPRLSSDYQPALDGMRGLAVAAVLAFHAKATWMTGGYIGVSVFFTLSGFLITRLLINEHETTGAIRLGAFYGRRARRLLPAALVAIVGVALAADNGWFGAVPHLRADLFGAAFQVSNWVQLLRGGSYADQIAAHAGVSSPLIHFWSLSIEEQYYWIWPAAMIALFAVSRRRGWRIHRQLVVAAVVMSAGAVAIAHVWGPNAAYWATPARAAEILVGAALAGVLHAGARVHVPGWAGALAALALLTACILLPSDHGLAYTGGLPLVACATALLLAALQRPGRLTSLLGMTPLRSLGKISYGVYVFHWPVFVAFSERSHLSGAPLVAAELATTLALSLASYVLLEQRVRDTRLRLRTGVAVATASMLVAVCTIVTVPAVAGSYWSRAPADPAADAPAGALAPLVPLIRSVGGASSGGGSSGRSGGAGDGGAMRGEPSVEATVAGEPAANRTAEEPTADRPAGGDPAATAAAVSGGAVAASSGLAAGNSSSATAPGSPAPSAPDEASDANLPIVQGATDDTATKLAVNAATVSVTAPGSPSSSALPLDVAPPPVPRPVRILVVGDSTAEATGNGLLDWAAANPQLARVATAASPGCGLLQGTIPRDATDRKLIAGCGETIGRRLPVLLRTFAPDVVVVMVTFRDHEPKDFGNGVVPNTDLDYQARFHSSYQAFIDAVTTQTHARIVFAKMPTTQPYWFGNVAEENDFPARDFFEAELSAFAVSQPQRIQLLDFRTWVTAAGLDDDHTARPDGQHWAPAAARQIATRWLGPTLMQIAVQP